ncbi:hypothetical protein AB6806_20005 [Bosea sp. RCC_152_1]|uniref:hypothetical protein n=1 Tax=Bosea sp. RCC_152_1 TaxID=3239228 RepID=UPI0035252F9B
MNNNDIRDNPSVQQPPCSDVKLSEQELEAMNGAGIDNAFKGAVTGGIGLAGVGAMCGPVGAGVLGAVGVIGGAIMGAFAPDSDGPVSGL